MALLQALLAFVSRSAGKVLNAVFGWAVIALFGRSARGQQTLLTIVVALAAVWPVLLLGIVFPKVTVFLVAFIPLVSEASTGIVRAVWIALAVLVPAIVGLVLAGKAPPGVRADPFFVRVLRGFPVTLGIAGAFVLMFVTVPILRITSAARGWRDEHVPLITTGADYQRAAEKIDRLLHDRGLEAGRSPPAWWLSAPTLLLARLCGKALDGYLPERLAYWRGPSLELALHASDLLVRGEKKQSAWLRGLVEEVFAAGPGLSTYDARAQDLERQLQEIWRVHADYPRAHTGARPLLARLDEVAREIGKLEVGYDQWQTLYRKALQLGRALAGQAQLLQGVVPLDPRPTRALRVRAMAHDDEPNTMRHLETKLLGDGQRVTNGADAMPFRAPGQRPLAGVPTRELISRTARQGVALVKKEIELARVELQSDVRREIAMAKGLGVAGACALVGVTLLLVAAVFALAQMMAPWLAALLVAAVVLATGAAFGLAGWAKRARVPLENTRKTIKEDVRWIRERIA